jgi:hypothetical protein
LHIEISHCPTKATGGVEKATEKNPYAARFGVYSSAHKFQSFVPPFVVSEVMMKIEILKMMPLIVHRQGASASQKETAHCSRGGGGNHIAWP